MANEVIGEFSVLSPSQKRELERKREEKEARDAENAAKRAEAARKAREAAKRAEEERIAAKKAKNAAREAEIQQKKTLLYCGIVILCVLIVLVIWLWIHLCHLACMSIFGDDKQVRVLCGILFIYIPSLLIVAPISAGILGGISKMAKKIKALK